MTSDAPYWIEELQLQKHPEGGYYRVTYTASTEIALDALPAGFSGKRAVSTAIYFLLTNQSLDIEEHFSAFHRLLSDEMWHFYAGSPLVVHVIHRDGSYEEMLIGPDVEQGEQFQAVVKAGCWFASELVMPNTFALVGCTVSPGFDFNDFALAKRDELTSDFPQHSALIAKLTRK